MLSAAAGGGQPKASATTFSWPGVCLMSNVNSAMKDSCRCWRVDQGGVVRNRDVTGGLWSVSRRNRPPSSRNLKCLTALPAPFGQLLKNAPYACVGGVRCQESPAFGAGCASSTTAARAALAASKAAAEAGGHSSVLGSPRSDGLDRSGDTWEGNVCKNSPHLKTVVIFQVL